MNPTSMNPSRFRHIVFNQAFDLEIDISSGKSFTPRQVASQHEKRRQVGAPG